MKEKPSYYAIIPAEVRYSKKLTPNAKLLYAEITALCNMNGKCTASTEYFCRLYEVSRVSIQNWLKMLEDNNYINRTVNIYLQGSKEIDLGI
jgi:response regulator of citrate/malate metabolism